jgi:hypothetical protein
LMFAGASKFYEILDSNGRTMGDRIKDFFRGGFTLFEYLLKQEKAERKAELFKLNPGKDMLERVFNSDDTLMAKAAITAVLPRIAYSKVMYIPRHFPQITPELVTGWIRNNDFGVSPAPLRLPDTKLTDVKEYT